MKRKPLILAAIIASAAVAGTAAWYFWPDPPPPPFPTYSSTGPVIPPPTEWHATVSGPESVTAAEPFKVDWTGPARAGDFVTIVKPDAEQHEYDSYKSPRQRSTITLTAPGNPGDYELRYVAFKNGDRILARQPITVIAQPASITLPSDTAKGGGTLVINWDGPGKPFDTLTVVRAGAAPESRGPTRRLRKGTPARLPMPLEAGDYEIRYVLGGNDHILASAPISITKTTTELKVPAEIDAGQPINVEWTGPAGDGDRVELRYLDPARTRAVRPIQSLQPKSPGVLVFRRQWRAGQYELKYTHGASGQQFARVQFEVLPRTQPRRENRRDTNTTADR